MTKQELLEKLETKELIFLTALDEKERLYVISEWLQLDETETAELAKKSRGEQINRYMENYMEWKNSYSVAELEAIS